MKQLNLMVSFDTTVAMQEIECAAAKAASSFESRKAFEVRLQNIIASEKEKAERKAQKRAALCNSSAEEDLLKKIDLTVYKTVEAFFKEKKIAALKERAALRKISREQAWDRKEVILRQYADHLADIMWTQCYDSLIRNEVSEFGMLKRALIDLRVNLLDWASEKSSYEERKAYRILAKWIDKTYLRNNAEIRKLRKELIKVSQKGGVKLPSGKTWEYNTVLS